MKKNEEKKDLIVIITTNDYPNGDAGAIRQHVMAKALVESGYKVFIIGYGKIAKEKINKFDNIPYISLKTKSKNIFLRLFSRILFGKKAINYIHKNLKNVKGFLVVDRITRFVF